MNKLDFEDKAEKKMVKKRFKKAVPTTGLCAYMVHPKYRGTLHAGTDTKLALTQQNLQLISDNNRDFLFSFR